MLVATTGFLDAQRLIMSARQLRQRAHESRGQTADPIAAWNRMKDICADESKGVIALGCRGSGSPTARFATDRIGPGIVAAKKITGRSPRISPKSPRRRRGAAPGCRTMTARQSFGCAASE